MENFWSDELRPRLNREVLRWLKGEPKSVITRSLRCEKKQVAMRGLHHYIITISVYINICIPLHTNHDCDELSNDMGDVPCISVTKTRQFHKHTTLKGSRHFSCGWTHQYRSNNPMLQCCILEFSAYVLLTAEENASCSSHLFCSNYGSKG